VRAGSTRRSGRVVLAALLLVLAMVGAACSSSGGGQGASTSASASAAAPSGDLRLFSYGDGFDPAYIKSFKQQYPDVNLETSPFSSNDEAVAKLQAGFQADVINSCVDESALEMVQKGLYAPLDTSRIPDWKNVFPAFQQLPGVQQDGKLYMVPVDAGTAGLLYDADAIKTPPTSWTDLFDPQYKGRAGLENNSVTAIDVGALATGISDPLGMDADQLDSVKNYLIDHKDQFRSFWHSDAEVQNLFKSGEIVISSGYPGNALRLQREGVNVKFAPATEGQMLWTCGYGISPQAQNVDAAYALLNWYLSPKAEMFEAKTWDYTIANTRVLKVAPPAFVKKYDLAQPYHWGNAIPASPPKDRQSWTQAWAEVQAA
jgi:spermidine/putrescine transport system substrate-binding protein